MGLSAQLQGAWNRFDFLFIIAAPFLKCAVFIRTFCVDIRNRGGILEDLNGLFEQLRRLLEYLAIILELPVFIRRFFGILELFIFN